MKRHSRLGMFEDLWPIILLLSISFIWSDPCFAKEGSYYPNGLTEYRQNLKIIPVLSLRPQSNYKSSFCSNDEVDSTQKAQFDNDEYPDSLDPQTAFVMAFLPGFFVHGLGHYYIGDNHKGSLLLATEGLSVLLMTVAVIGGGGEGNQNNYGGSQSNSADWVFYPGAILFLGSWAYDFIDAPKQAKRMLVESQRKVLIIPSIDKKQLKLELSLRF